ncbi:MAG TPA: AtpZ/AtpI family protein [Jatrophihabitans sp.]|nr:AtpZ/AtpI family protein [Jatrophihabitans sp.]
MPDEPDRSIGWSTLLGMGVVIAAELVAGLGLGWLVDSLAGTAPIFLLIGLLLGIAAAVSYTVVEFRKYLNN